MNVTIIGTGFLGLLLVQLAKDAGANVFAVSRRPDSLKMAESFGADYLLTTDEPDKVQADIDKITKGDMCDCVIEATGKQKPLDLAAKLTSIRGRLVIAGYHQDGLRHVDMQLWNWRGIDIINAHERDPLIYMSGMKEAVRAIRDGVMNPFPLFTHTFPMEDLQLAFEAQQNKPDGFIKALILFK